MTALLPSASLAEMESFLTTVSNLIREKELPALMIGGQAFQ
ncbi:MAG: hypothetical protein OSA84_11695 [Akkermansiaceae bacterium]|nr:hypothetical protein [Akkermansiaceae bacterium]